MSVSGRRRRRALAWRLALVVAGAISLGIALADSQPDPTSSAPAAAITRGPVTSVPLPRAGQYSSLAVVGPKLIVWGGSEGTIESVPAASSTGATCQAAEVNPRTLMLSGVRRGNCADPALYRERVLANLNHVRGGPSGDIGTLRIAAVAPTARGGYALGPVLLRYDQCSDCGLSVAYGDGSLWIYAPSPIGARPNTARLLRISEQTGRVTQAWKLPTLYQALLASDRDGLWIAPSLYSGFPAHATAAQRRAAESLYHVSAGTRTPRRTLSIGPSGARWLVASGTSVWLDTGSPTATQLIRLAGPGGRVVSRVKLGAPPCGELGKGPSSVAGDATGGIYCLGVSDRDTGAVYRFDAGAQRPGVQPVASIPGVAAEDFAQPAAMVGKAYFFLEPPNVSSGPAPTSTATAHGAGVLYRVDAR
jgi:hypothetical protein